MLAASAPTEKASDDGLPSPEAVRTRALDILPETARQVLRAGGHTQLHVQAGTRATTKGAYVGDFPALIQI
jgi:hypothetical protein